MQSSASQYYPEFHSFFNKEKTCVETETKFNLISSIQDDGHILSIDENNWKWLWCTKVFQGINATKALDCALGKKLMHVRSILCSQGQNSYNKIPGASEFQTGSEEYSS